MPWKFLFSLLLIAVLMVFIGFNWSNVSDISVFGLYTFAKIPIVITIGISFIAGSLLSILYTIRSAERSRKKVHTATDTSNEELAHKNVHGKKKKGKAKQPAASNNASVINES